MNTLQAEQIKELIKVIQEKGGIETVNVVDFITMENGTVVFKIEQYFHFFPNGVDNILKAAPIEKIQHEYLIKERANQKTTETSIYDIYCENKLVGWIHHTKFYTPHIRIIAPNHILDSKSITQALKDSEIDKDGMYMLLSEIQSNENKETEVKPQ